MALRVLFWNIQDFGLNKIANPSTKPQKGAGKKTRAVASAERKDYVLAHLTALDPEPDIVVIVELETTYIERGRLVTSKAINAANTLLDALRGGTDAAGEWMLVPPLQTGNKEGVMVFYNSTKLALTGPYLWPGGDGGTSSKDADPNDYPAELAGWLPAARVVPDGARFNKGKPERQCAGRVEFSYNKFAGKAQRGKPIVFADTARAPYMVTFAELSPDDDSVVTRNITLFAVHSPASYSAGAYLENLAKSTQFTEDNIGNEVRIIAGDFNVNVMSKPPDFTESARYRPLQIRNYQLELAPLAVPPAAPAGYAGYFATHIQPRTKAVYWSTAANTVYYPAYGYSGSDQRANFYAIDNIFTRYGSKVVAPDPNNMTVMNGIVGSPYNLHPVPKADTPPGTLVFPIAMDAAAFQAPPAEGPDDDDGLHTSFRGWLNYGKIRSTSDHLALVIDV
ncbi:MAG TPA: endonuclease/exonuclease/phosphatase family protein [Candidatus Kapabacteria bacterium]|nr:endonuclease/exonuclease/phosphatase family protein [Candidatus Kapabacteria bacterium]